VTEVKVAKESEENMSNHFHRGVPTDIIVVKEIVNKVNIYLIILLILGPLAPTRTLGPLLRLVQTS